MSLEAHYSPVAQAMEQNPLRPSWTMQRPGLISLAYGFPDSQSFPYDELAEATAGLMAAHNAEALQYGPVSGPEPLRRFLADWACTTEGLDVGPDNIMITSGASQGIALAARLLVPPGGTVIVESPTFIGALWFFRGLGINVCWSRHRQPGHRPLRAAGHDHPGSVEAGADVSSGLHHAHRA